MKYTNPFVLVLAAAAGGVIVWALETWLTTTGSPAFVPSPAFGITLLVIAAAVLAVAWPVRRYTAGMRRVRELRRASSTPADQDALESAQKDAAAKRIAPERAVLALALAKASALAGALFFGGAIGAMLWTLTRPVSSGSFGESLFAGVSAALLVAAGLLAEWWCVLPPEDGDAAPSTNPAVTQ